jgi:hypothetical protein
VLDPRRYHDALLHDDVPDDGLGRIVRYQRDLRVQREQSVRLHAERLPRNVIMNKLVLVALFASVGCTTNNDTGIDPPAPAGGRQLASKEFHLAPGQETYICYTFDSPSDLVAITKVEPLYVTGVHHIALFRALAKEPANEADGAECGVLFRTTWLPIWVSGQNSPGLTLPDGVGFKVDGKSQYVLQLHLQNATDKELAVRSGVNLWYQHDAASVQPASIFGIGTFQFEIPANTTDYQLPIDCAFKSDMNVFGVLPHMHKLGTQFDVEQWNDSAPDAKSLVYHIDPWQFGSQPMDAEQWTLHAGDHMRSTCHWNNSNANPVVFGESSDQEMCFFVLFFYPADGPDACLL